MEDAKVLEVIVTKVSLERDESLFVQIKSDDITPVSLDYLGNHLRSMFPRNQVVVMGLGKNDDIKLISVKDASKIEKEEPQFCANCSCGKKEAFEQKSAPLTEEELNKFDELVKNEEE